MDRGRASQPRRGGDHRQGRTGRRSCVRAASCASRWASTPRKPNLHVGHLVGLRKMRQFQDTRPPGRAHRRRLDGADRRPIGPRREPRHARPRDGRSVNAETYMQQFFTVIDRANTEVRWQSEWFEQVRPGRRVQPDQPLHAGQMLAHETFRQRYDQGLPLTMMEMMYPLLQALRFHCHRKPTSSSAARTRSSTSWPAANCSACSASGRRTSSWCRCSSGPTVAR